MTPIIIEETIKEIATKATNTYETVSTIVVTEDIKVPTVSVKDITFVSSVSAIRSLYALRIEITFSLESKSLG